MLPEYVAAVKQVIDYIKKEIRIKNKNELFQKISFQ